MNRSAAMIALAGILALAALAPIASAQTAARPEAGPAVKSGAKSGATPEAAAMTPGPRFSQSGKVSLARGEQIYMEYCAVCHGMHGKGDGPRAAFFADIQYIPDLTLEGFLDDRDTELLTNIREGLARYDEPAIVMPQFKYILSENDMRSALAYVKTFAAPAPAPKPKAKRTR